MKKIITLFVVLIGLTTFACVDEDAAKKQDTSESTSSSNSAIRVFSTESSFEDAKEDLLSSIVDNGLVVSYTSHAKAMLDRTAEVAGNKASVYDNAEIILFCKANLSHELLAADPHNIVLCPYAIAIYVLHTEPERVYLSFREQDESQAVTKPISELLTSIIADVI